MNKKDRNDLLILMTVTITILAFAVWVIETSKTTCIQECIKVRAYQTDSQCIWYCRYKGGF